MKSVSKPNFFIIGAPKCGTSALAHYLSEHPSVFFCQPKEPFFWDTDHANCRKTYDLQTEHDYLKLFRSAIAGQHSAIGEGSTTYLQSHLAVKNILEFDPAARFIVMLRNPVEIAHGMHGELVRHFYEDVLNFEDAWRLQKERAEGRSLPRNPHVPHQLQYQAVASIGSQLERLFQLVPENQRLVLLFDDFVRNTASVYKSVQLFLDIKDDGRQEFPKVNEARQYRLAWLGRSYHSPPRVLQRPMRFLRTQLIQRAGPVKYLLSRIVARKQPREALRPEFRDELNEVFREDVTLLSRLVGRDFSHWTA